MKILYAGYRRWSFKIAKALIKNEDKYKVEAILTTKNAEAEFNSLKKDTFVIDPNKLTSKETLKIFEKYNPKVILFYGWSWMIPEEIYGKYICLIYHISPLPKYRGGSPIQNQIINGEKESAGTILRAVKEVDAGPIYSQSPISLDGSMNEIFERVVRVGIQDTKKVIKGIASGKLQPKPQDETKKTVFKRRHPDKSEIMPEDFKNKTAKEMYDFIRALGDPYPNAFIRCKNGEKLFIKWALPER